MHIENNACNIVVDTKKSRTRVEMELTGGEFVALIHALKKHDTKYGRRVLELLTKTKKNHV